MTQSYDNWRAVVKRSERTKLPPERLAEMHAATCKFGSGNGWTGTSSVLCEMIRELLREVEWLRQDDRLA
jgi:hypothetical protein